MVGTHHAEDPEPTFFGLFATLAGQRRSSGARVIGAYDDVFADFYVARIDEYTADLGFYLKCAQRTAGSILELGCGHGRITRALAAGGHNAVGIDSSARLIAIGRQRLRSERQPKGTLRVGDLFAPLPPESQDLIIISSSMLPCFIKLGGVSWLRGLRLALRPSGALALDVASGATPVGRLGLSEVVSQDGRLVQVLHGATATSDGGHLVNLLAIQPEGRASLLASERIVPSSPDDVTTLLMDAGFTAIERTPLLRNQLDSDGVLALT